MCVFYAPLGVFLQMYVTVSIVVMVMVVRAVESSVPHRVTPPHDETGVPFLFMDAPINDTGDNHVLLLPPPTTDDETATQGEEAST